MGPPWQPITVDSILCEIHQAGIPIVFSLRAIAGLLGSPGRANSGNFSPVFGTPYVLGQHSPDWRGDEFSYGCRRPGYEPKRTKDGNQTRCLWLAFCCMVRAQPGNPGAAARWKFSKTTFAKSDLGFVLSSAVGLEDRLRKSARYIKICPLPAARNLLGPFFLMYKFDCRISRFSGGADAPSGKMLCAFVVPL